MAKLLLADSDPDRAARLAAALGPAGHEVTVARTGAYALTMLERGRPDLLVTRDRLDDMDVVELTAVVRGDPATRRIPLVLLKGGTVVDVPDVDLVLDGENRIGVFLVGIENVLAVHRRAASTAVAPVAPPSGLRGSFAVMDLPEVAQAFALGTKTGQLSLTLPFGAGTIVFENGRVIHAEYGVIKGERAFAALVRAARAGGEFSFTAIDAAEIGGLPRTMRATVERLLLAAASDIDEDHVGPPRSGRVKGS